MRKVYIIIFALFILTSCAEYIVKDDGVYYKDWNEGRGSETRLLKGADPKTFETLSNDEYGKDSKFVFFRGSRIDGADAKSFEFLSDLYAKDKNRAYYAGDSIESSSSNDFKIIDSYYSSDYKDIFCTTKPLHVCTTNGFKIFDNENKESDFERWSTDGCFYYFKEKKIPSDDYKNVYIFKGSCGFAKDTKWVYISDRKINVNDTGKVILDTVDVATFTVTNYLDCKDKFGCINPFLGRESCK